MKNIALLGSTGSIGRQTVEVALANPNKIKIKALVAHKSDELLEEQIKLLAPDLAVLSDKEAAARLAARYLAKQRFSLARRECWQLLPTRGRTQCWLPWWVMQDCGLPWQQLTAAKILP